MPENPAAQIAVAKGLEGVIAAATAISSIDGTAGRLTYRGIPIEELAANSFYEEVAYFLWYGVLPTREQLHTFVAARLPLERHSRCPTQHGGSHELVVSLIEQVLNVRRKQPSSAGSKSIGEPRVHDLV